MDLASVCRVGGVILVGLTLLAPITAGAQETLGSYYAALGPQDYRNSKGAPLQTFAAVVQQDRANYHRFGERDPQDEGDAFFDRPEARASIPALFAKGDNGFWETAVHAPTSAPLDADVYVVLCGTGGRLTHLIINHANGDGYTMCEGAVSAGD